MAFSRTFKAMVLDLADTVLDKADEVVDEVTPEVNEFVEDVTAEVEAHVAQGLALANRAVDDGMNYVQSMLRSARKALEENPETTPSKEPVEDFEARIGFGDVVDEVKPAGSPRDQMLAKIWTHTPLDHYYRKNPSAIDTAPNWVLESVLQNPTGFGLSNSNEFPDHL